MDLFRAYPASLLGLGTGQFLNLAAAAGGVALLCGLGRRRRPAPPAGDPAIRRPRPGLVARRVALALLVAFPLVIPSDWTQDVPARYGKRHPMRASWLYGGADRVP